MAANSSLKSWTCLIIFAFFLFETKTVFATTETKVDGAVSRYTDANRSEILASSLFQVLTDSFFSAQGFVSGFALTYSRTDRKYLKPDAVLKDQLSGKSKLSQNSLGLNLSQGLGIGRDLQLGLGRQQSDLGSSKWLTIGLAEWLLSETLQISIDYQNSSSSQKEAYVYNEETQLIALPTRIDGRSFSLGLKNYTTPTTILIGGLSHTLRSDRPDASSLTLELRQFINPLKGAFHLNVNHFENVGEIKPITDYGTVVANAARAEWHQHLNRILPFFNRSILMVGYRYYLESENPSGPSKNNALQTEWIYSALKIRTDNKKLWFQDSSEIYLLGGSYGSSNSKRGLLVGSGAKVLF